jgi:hypothetical protein
MTAGQQGLFAGGINVPPIPLQPNGTSVFGWNPRIPQPIPRVDPAMPAAQMTNSSGGMGCEPGYNYFFPPEHTKVHVYKSKIPPWQCPAYSRLEFTASHVPSNTTLEVLLKGFGCTNAVAKKNRCYEIAQAGDGKFYKGFAFGGDEKERMKQTIKEIGWDSTRTGRPGEKPVVSIWLSKD